MANLYTSVLGTAGLSPDQFGLEILLDLPNRSVMMPLVESYVIERGETLTLPKLGARTLTAVTRGSGETSAITYGTVSDTGATMTKRFAYDAWEWGIPTLNDMPAANLAVTVNGLRFQASAALGNDVDARLLALYSSAASSVGGAGADFSIGALSEAIELLEVANAPRPYYAVLPSTQTAVLAQTDELNRFDIRGEGNSIVNGVLKRFQGVDIYTTGNVPTSAGTAHGLVFSSMGIRLAVRDMATVQEWADFHYLAASRVLVYSDYAYANSFTDWIVDFQTTAV